MIRTCEQCGKEFKPSHSYIRFCSRQCAGRSRTVLTPITCGGCGKEFKPHYSTTKFCSCQCAGRSRTILIPINCQECGSEFQPRSSKTKFCSLQCTRRSRIVLVPIICRECGKEFKPYNSRIIFCSHRCASAFRRQCPKSPINHCTYVWKDVDTVFYVGRGQGKRPYEDRSPGHPANARRDTAKDFHVEIEKEGMTEEEAIYREAILIDILQPECNQRAGSSAVPGYLIRHAVGITTGEINPQ